MVCFYIPSLIVYQNKEYSRSICKFQLLRKYWTKESTNTKIWVNFSQIIIYGYLESIEKVLIFIFLHGFETEIHD